MRIQVLLSEVASEAMRDVFGLEDADPVLRPTTDASRGDYQLNGALPLAKRLKKPPRELAEALAEAMRAHPAVASAEVAGPGFVNLTLATQWICERLRVAFEDRERGGVPKVDQPARVVVDFSAPNIAKEMHVAHLRSTIIGAAIVKLLRFVGHDVIGDNHIGDWGTQYGLLIVGMQEFGDDAAFENAPLPELTRIYRLSSAKAKEDEGFAERARTELAKLQSGDPDNTAMWQRFVDATMASLKEVYQRLDVEFDLYMGESSYHPMLEGLVDRLIDRGLAREDQGSICVWFNEIDEAPPKLKKLKVPLIVRKKDGAFLYATTDVAAILYRRDELHAARAIYVVDSRQAGHFEQVFGVTALMGVEMKLEHAGFGMLMGADGKPFKSRSGETIRLTDLLDEAEQRALDLMREELSLPEDEARALAAPVGVGAVKYADLSQNRTSDYKFEWEKLISFKGDAGPYLQYAHARCCSILRKGGVQSEGLQVSTFTFEEAKEEALAKRLLKFADVVHDAAELSFPHFVAEHLYALAREFSAFYDVAPVLKAPSPLKESRLGLVDLTRRQLAQGLGLLGIEAPPRM